MLIFVRHAPVLVKGLCYGQAEVPTVPLEELGDDFERCTAEIARCTQGRPPLVVCSPSRRTALLAARLAASWPGSEPPRADPRLLELSMGVWEARSFVEIEDTDRARFETWMRHWQTASPPGGETLDQLLLRVGACLAELSPHEDHLVVTHAGVIRAYWVLRGVCDWMAAMHKPVPFLGVVAGEP